MKKNFSKEYQRGYEDARNKAVNDSKYNGWTNYETWNCKLWIDNEQGDQEYWIEQAKDVYEGAKKSETFSKVEQAVLDLKDTLKNYFEEQTPEVTGFYADMLNAALSEVNWYEIAMSLIEDNMEEWEETK